VAPTFSQARARRSVHLLRVRKPPRPCTLGPVALLLTLALTSTLDCSLLRPRAALAASVASNAITQESPATAPAQAQSPEPEYLVDSERLGLNVVYLLLGLGLGFAFGIARLIAKFRRFLGLGILKNAYSWLFLALVTVASGLAYLVLDGPARVELLTSQLPALGILGSSVMGNLTALVGRLRGGMRLSGHAADQVLELRETKTKDLLFDLIRGAIGRSLDQEVSRMARRYDLETIQDAVGRLVESEVTLGRLSPEAMDAAMARIKELEPTGDQRKDFNMRYMALQRAIQVSSFRDLRARLANASLNGDAPNDDR